MCGLRSETNLGGRIAFIPETARYAIGIVRLEPAGDRSALDAEFLDTGDENEYNPKLVPVDISIYLGTPDFTHLTRRMLH